MTKIFKKLIREFESYILNYEKSEEKFIQIQKQTNFIEIYNKLEVKDDNDNNYITKDQIVEVLLEYKMPIDVVEYLLQRMFKETDTLEKLPYKLIFSK